MNTKTPIPDVNYHFIKQCNMKCKFCFAIFENMPQLEKPQAVMIVKKLAEYGFRKINFVGGEPTLSPWLIDLLKQAKEYGMTTSIVTNGLLINKRWYEVHREYVDWIGFSIDSLIRETSINLGRCSTNKYSLSLNDYIEKMLMAKELGLKTKINTVVTRLNLNEDFHNLVSITRPEKWKVFQMLLIKNENDQAVSLKIYREEFETFIQNHNDLNSVTKIYPETNDDMTSSYIMVDPSGCFFDNSNGYHLRSDKILKVGVSRALDQVDIAPKKYYLRQNPISSYARTVYHTF